MCVRYHSICCVAQEQHNSFKNIFFQHPTISLYNIIIPDITVKKRTFSVSALSACIFLIKHEPRSQIRWNFRALVSVVTCIYILKSGVFMHSCWGETRIQSCQSMSALHEGKPYSYLWFITNKYSFIFQKKLLSSNNRHRFINVKN